MDDRDGYWGEDAGPATPWVAAALAWAVAAMTLAIVAGALLRG